MLKKLLILAGVVGAAALVAKKVKAPTTSVPSGTRRPPRPTCASRHRGARRSAGP